MPRETFYNPEATPSAAEWLDLPEPERLRAVSTFHMAHRIKSGNAKAHAAIHVIVENQIAMGFGPTVRAMARLQSQGLSRHEALHAVGCVVSTRMFDAMRNPEETNSHTLQSEVNAAIERLDAQSWRGEYGAEADVVRGALGAASPSAETEERPGSPASLVHAEPLSDEELSELDSLLMDLDAEETMTLDMLDGFLHALAIGPETIMPSRWLPMVWGQEDGVMLPPVDDLDQANHLVGLVMRHFNSVVSGFENNPPWLAPLWPSSHYGDGIEFEDAEMWAYGFNEGVNLSRTAWQALFDHPDGFAWYRPIGLLGADDFSADQDELTRTPEQRAALAEQIEASLLHIHAFWLPLRQAVGERHTAQRMSTKVGRNEPCPCGSGRKFKKCCGAPSELH